MRGEFPFGEKRTALGILADPIIRIPILTKYGYQNFDFLVDTGADCSMMPAAAAQDLSIDLEDSSRIKFQGIGGESVSARIARIKMKIIEEPIAVTCAFAARENTPFILGRKDIFSKFSLTFDNSRKRIRFTPI